MFSGIVKALEKPVKILRSKYSLELVFPVPNKWRVEKGDSIAIDGICSTITQTDGKTFSVFYMAETLRKTTLTFLPDGHMFNLEQPLRLNDFVGGHLTSGHIDTVGNIESIEKDGQASVIVIGLPFSFTRYIIYKGSIAVNGVSLTVVSVANTSFTVSLIPHTLRYTNLGLLLEKDSVNLEVDLFAKYLEKLQKSKA